MSVVLCDRVRGWWDRCYNGLLESLKAVELFKLSPGALYELPLGDQRSASVIARPFFREGLDECFDVVVIRCEGVYEMGDCGWLLWGAGDGGR